MVLRNRLLACGVAASAIAIVGDLVAGRLSTGYDFVHQSSSELSAIGASTRPFVVPVGLTRDALLSAFAVGLWRSAGEHRGLRITAVLVGAHAAGGFVAQLVPMHAGQPATDNPTGVVIGAAGVVALTAAIASGAISTDGRIRTLSLAVVVAFAVLAVAGLALRQPAVGAQERTMAYAYWLWIAVIAASRWRRSAHATRAATAQSRIA